GLAGRVRGVQDPGEPALTQSPPSAQMPHLCSVAKSASTLGSGGTSDSTSWLASTNRGQAGAPPAPGTPGFAELAAPSCINPASPPCVADRVPCEPAGRPNRYCSSAACVAAYGKPAVG